LAFTSVVLLFEIIWSKFYNVETKTKRKLVGPFQIPQMNIDNSVEPELREIILLKYEEIVELLANRGYY
jgi:hypothetical protein